MGMGHVAVFFQRPEVPQAVFWHAQLLPMKTHHRVQKTQLSPFPQIKGFLLVPLGDVAQPHLAHMPCRSVSCMPNASDVTADQGCFCWVGKRHSDCHLHGDLAWKHQGSKHQQLHWWHKMSWKRLEKYVIELLFIFELYHTYVSVSKDWDHLPQLSWKDASAHQFPTYICFTISTTIRWKGSKDKQLDPFGMVVGIFFFKRNRVKTKTQGISGFHFKLAWIACSVPDDAGSGQNPCSSRCFNSQHKACIANQCMQVEIKKECPIQKCQHLVLAA